MEYEQVGLLQDQFTRQAKATPDRVAVVSPEENVSLTFAELAQWTENLAITLQAKGIGPETMCGIFLDKNISFVVSYIAALKAGGAYLPIDTSYPSHLLDAVLSDAQPTVIVTSPDLMDRINAYPAEKVVVLGKGWQSKMQADQGKAGLHLKSPDVNLDSLAYAVYSSGTTGKPKGIMCPQRGAVFSYHHRHTNYPYQEGSREACNIFFVWELLRPLLKGVPLYIMSNSIMYDPAVLCQFIKTHTITRMLFTPSLLETVLNMMPPETLQDSMASLRQIIFCGEVVTTSLLERCVQSMPQAQLINLYSVSECHDAMCGDLSEMYRNNKKSVMSRKFCPVGQILPGVDVSILDDKGKVQPVGVSGEIYVSGPTLARGYINRPLVQKERFVNMTLSPGNTRLMYRTGDWGYMLSDSSLEICGRVDTMVKIRGYSIEVQGVESSLLTLPQVKACVALVHGKEGEEKVLVAYIVPEGSPSKKEIRAELKKRLPFYMIPSHFLFLNSIPILAASGKLDKKALPAINSQKDAIGKEGRPSTETECALAQMWSDVLKLEEVDIQESFFDLGGHSLMATELLQQMKQKFDVQLAVRDLFTHPTVASLAKLIDARLAKGGLSEQGSEEDLLPKIDLMSEVRTHDLGISNIDMQLRAFWRAFHHGHHFHRGRVLLTGATGFLGAFLLKDMLINTNLVVYCLVRDLPHQSTTDRILKNLREYGILTSDPLQATEEQKKIKEAFDHRVTALRGNVSLMHLGLSEEDYTYVCTDIDFIIHAAAAVNLAYPYSALHGANVIGTANVIQFAATGKVKALHYISTDGVFPNGLQNVKEDTDITPYADQLTDGYSQSKWVAEQLVSRSMDRGLPVTIYRLGNMSGDSKHAYWNPQDFTLLLLQACAKTGLAPDIDWDLEMTPVDFVAQAIVRLTQTPEKAIGRTLHLVNDKPMKAKEVFDWMNSHGYSLKRLQFEDWRARVMKELQAENGPNDLNAEMMSRVLDSYVNTSDFLSSLSSFDNQNMKELLTEVGLHYPYIDTKQLRTYFRELSKRSVMTGRNGPADHKPLADKVAVVTGASSGIGQATAEALASAGAKVTLAARRVELLQGTVNKINSEGGEAIGVKTDVTDWEQVKAMVEQTEASLGPVDILVNNAGVMYYTMMKNLHHKEWNSQIDVNCKGVTNTVGAVIESMIARGKGHIINISSDAGRRGFAGLAVYSGTKFFVEGMSQALRHELLGTGIKITCVQPGDVQTPLQVMSTDKEANDKYSYSGNFPIMDPSDIASTIVFAASLPAHVALNEILIEPREAPI